MYVILSVSKRKRRNKLLDYFTYGKYITETDEVYDLTTKGRKAKIRIKKKSHLKAGQRKGSRRGSTADIKNLYNLNKRKESNADSAEMLAKARDALVSNKNVQFETGDHSSDLASDMSRDVSGTLS